MKKFFIALSYLFILFAIQIFAIQTQALPDNSNLNSTAKGSMIARFIRPIKWLEKAAEQGDAEAQYKMGMFYKNSYRRTVITTNPNAEKWLKLAAEQGHAGAQNTLGEIELNKENFSKAKEWFKKAKSLGDVYIQVQLKEVDRAVKRKIRTEEEIRVLAELGGIESQFRWGVIKGSRYWLKKAAEKDHSLAPLVLKLLQAYKESKIGLLANMYENEEGITVENFEKILKELENKVAQKDKVAPLALEVLQSYKDFKIEMLAMLSSYSERYRVSRFFRRDAAEFLIKPTEKIHIEAQAKLKEIKQNACRSGFVNAN